MRRVLLLALTACSLIFAAPYSRADEAESQTPVQIADVSSGHTPSITASTNSLQVAFQNEGAIFHSSSSNHGKSWSTAIRISGKGDTCFHPHVRAGADGSLNMVWEDRSAPDAEGEIYFSRSTDDGKTWSSPDNISHTADSASSEPEVSLGSDNSVNVCWIDQMADAKTPNVYYAVSKDAGKSWSKPVDVSNSPGSCSNPTIGVDSKGGAHVAWLDSRVGESHPDIFYSNNTNSTWSEGLNISHSPRASAHPKIACGPHDKVYIVWSDNSRKENAADIWCVISHKNGKFEKPLNISNTRGISSQPVMAVGPKDRIVIVWSDTSATMKVPDIWARTGFEEGFSNVMQLCNTEGESTHAAVTVFDKKAYVVWEENSSGASTIKACVLPISMAVGPAENVDAIQYGHSR